MLREQVIEVLHGALLPLAFVNAAWLGGSDAFGRADELSDVDLQVDVDDGHVAATFGAVEAALAAASPIVARLVMPMPTWHGHAQRFYRLRDTAEFTAVDVVVFQRSDPRRYYNQTERHGRPQGGGIEIVAQPPRRGRNGERRRDVPALANHAITSPRLPRQQDRDPPPRSR